MYPCPHPQVCGVRQHRDLKNCAALSTSTNSQRPDSTPTSTPPSSVVSPPDEQAERQAFRESGGEINQQYGPLGILIRESWQMDGKLHREDGPAAREWYPDGQLMVEAWYRENQLHRDGEPARRRWSKTGELRAEEWCQDDKRHRDDGPALLVFREDGSRDVYWYLEGQEYLKEDFNRVAAQLRAAKDAGFTDEMSRAWAGME